MINSRTSRIKSKSWIRSAQSGSVADVSRGEQLAMPFMKLPNKVGYYPLHS
jgi:hypothetical protein